MPPTGRPDRRSPRRMPQAGTPEMKARVPSMGSMIQDQSLAPGREALLLALDRAVGPGAGRPARISASTPRSAAVTGSKAPGPSLFSTSRGWRKCRARAARRPRPAARRREAARPRRPGGACPIPLRDAARQHGPVAARGKALPRGGNRRISADRPRPARLRAPRLGRLPISPCCARRCRGREGLSERAFLT